MGESGESALKRYIIDLNKNDISVLLTRDIQNNGFRLDVIKGERIETELVQPWVATSENWEWLLINRIRLLVEKLEKDI